MLVGILLIVLTAGLSYTIFDGIASTKVKEVSCDIGVKNPLLKDLEFTQVNCVSESKLFCSSGFSFIQSILPSDEATLRMNVQGDSISKTIDVTEFSTDNHEMTLCVSDSINKGIISLINSDGEILESQEVNF